MSSISERAASSDLGGPDSCAVGAPLCGDLDGTLVRSDMLIEGVLAFATNPLLYRAPLGQSGRVQTLRRRRQQVRPGAAAL